MTDLSTYHLVKLWEDDEFILSRGSRPLGPSLLVLAPASAQLTATGMARLQRAHALRDGLDPAWAARPCALIEHHGRPTLLSEDPGGALLAAQLDRPWSLDVFLRVALGLVAALRQMHARGLVHKDIKPANVLADAATGAVWLTGFGITSSLPRERQSPEPPEVIAGTLAYMAPEQTGRMNRSIDSRSDLYALGVTLYQLLAGTLPFTASEPMEWVHCHIARQPAPLQTVARFVPSAICDIVMKLLAKTAEERYQTAAGVEHDLRRARAAWESTGDAPAFALGAHDASDRLLIPEKLYGRDGEIGVLLSSLERVVSRGETELVLVSGYSGIGKSSVVNELHKVLVAPRGSFVSGKFDQYKRGIPYATLAQAFQLLIRQVLGKNEQEIAVWRERLSQALGTNGQLVSNLVPELELVIGQQPPVPGLSPKDAQARFQQVVRRFLGVFARAEHPLALFLDDLQWLDEASLELLEHLAGDPEVRHLLLVGAYRENEVGPAHPLALTIDRLRRKPERVREIVLAPLAIGDVAQLCGDALRASPASVRPLAELVHQKTAGNPFFAIQFINALVDERLLAFEPDRGGWRWDMEAIHAKVFTDNVADLMTARLDRLPASTRTALRQLASLGHNVRTATLSAVYGRSEGEIHHALQDVVIAGLVLRTATGYAFLHDRVQEAAYALLPESERAAEHLRIGLILADHASAAELDDRIFEIVNHLNRGAALLESQDQRDRVAALNLRSGRRAKASTAHAAARTYIAFGRSLLASDTWTRDFRLTFDLELQLADCEFLAADLHAAEERLAALSAHAVTLADRAAVLLAQTTLYTAMEGRSDHAIRLCLDYLDHVGVRWSPHPSEEVIQCEYQALLTLIGGRSIEDLLTLPVLTEPELTATVDVLLGMLTPAFNSDRGLVSLILCRMGNLGLQHGNCDASSLGYAFLGMVLGCSFGDYRTGFLFGKLARDLVEQRGLIRYRGRIYHTLGTHVLAWTQPIATALASLRRGFEEMREIGDVTYVGFAYCGIITLAIGAGDPLDSVQLETEKAMAHVHALKFEMAVDIFTGDLRLVRALRGLLPDPCTLDDGGRRFVGGLTTCWYWIRTMQACFIYGDMAAALVAMTRAQPLIGSSAGFFELPEYHFYAALVRAACLEQTAGQERLAHEVALADHRQQLAVWADNCPETFTNRLALVDAELARTIGRPLEAMDAYERAIRSARDSGFVHNEAIAFEVAARFYAARGFDTIARTYRQHARLGYLRWGANGKVRQLDELNEHAPEALAGAAPSAIEAPSSELDLATVVKTSQAVTSEVGLEKLIETLMAIALEHAGAERGLLILPRAGELHIEAEASTDGEKGVHVRLRRGVARHPELPETILHYASRTQETVLLADAQNPNAFFSDPYLREQRSRSVACIPLVKQAELVGLLYLENTLTPHVFTSARIAVLKLLASQTATSLQNASLEEENASLAEKESLLKEVHHRVKNNLQLISSLLNLQANRATDPVVAELFAESRNRVRSMALVHENLYQAGSFSKISMATHVRTLCAHLRRAYGLSSQNIELTTRVGDVHLEMNRAVSCGLIINELLSNALKHAFPEGRGGRVWIDFGAGADGQYVLTVGDDGVGLAGVDVIRADSLGLQLVRDLAEQLHGTVAVRGDPGTTFTITFGADAHGRGAR